MNPSFHISQLTTCTQPCTESQILCSNDDRLHQPWQASSIHQLFEPAAPTMQYAYKHARLLHQTMHTRNAVIITMATLERSSEGRIKDHEMAEMEHWPRGRHWCKWTKNTSHCMMSHWHMGWANWFFFFLKVDGYLDKVNRLWNDRHCVSDDDKCQN